VPSTPVAAPAAPVALHGPARSAEDGPKDALEVDPGNSPAGGGADAVYFGLQEGFNARARAGNFALATCRRPSRASTAPARAPT
jgi:hypothetical protein